eukprot:9938304-Lingulodinium_polyedra.AAC.1
MQPRAVSGPAACLAARRGRVRGGARPAARRGGARRCAHPAAHCGAGVVGTGRGRCFGAGGIPAEGPGRCRRSSIWA